MRRHFLKPIVLAAACLPGLLFAQDTASSGMKSDRDFAAQLLANEGVEFPVFLGCNQTPNSQPTLPVECDHNGLAFALNTVQVDEIDYDGLIASILPLRTWSPLAEMDYDTRFKENLMMQLAELDADPEWIWGMSSEGKSAVCMIGTNAPTDKRGLHRVFQSAVCFISFEAQRLAEEDTNLTLTLWDMGTGTFTFTQMEEARLLNFIEFLVYETGYDGEEVE